MTEDKPKHRTKTAASRAAKKTRAAAKKTALKKAVTKKAAKAAAKTVAAKKVARKSVPIKTARVSKRARLPPLPPPRAKVLGRGKGSAKTKAVCEIPACTEIVLRQKLRLAAPYLELWLAQRAQPDEADGATPEAAFVRIWQWLMLEATLEASHVVITPDLVEKLYAEEVGRRPII
jgi:hypothetical protein